MKTIPSNRFIILSTLILVAALTRAIPYLIPHMWNFTAIGALAIFGGAQFKDKRFAFSIPLCAMGISDLFIGNGFSGIVYVGFLTMVGCGYLIRKNITTMNVILASFVSASVFFLITNFAFLYQSTMYPHNLAGIFSSYAAGLPFFKNMLIGNLVFSGILFGSYNMILKKYPVLAEV